MAERPFDTMAEVISHQARKIVSKLKDSGYHITKKSKLAQWIITIPKSRGTQKRVVILTYLPRIGWQILPNSEINTGIQSLVKEALKNE